MEISLLIVVAIFAVLFMGLSIFLYVKIRLINSKRKNLEVKYQELERNLNGLKLENLESKLNPHLFKNILNSIQSHAYQTYFALDKLAGILDYILYESRKGFVTPKEEIEFALNLIEINKVKVSPLFELKVKTQLNESDPLFEQKVVVPLITVDLIENAFKHADLQSPDAFISILIEFKEHCLTLNVANKMSGRPALKKEKSGIGSDTLEQRLNIIYKDCFKLDRFIKDDVYIAHLKINLLEYKSKMSVA
ncbi:MAG: histidine kinase [Bacteroidetes bacterium]|nr:MAG: histidine kinase [Bacteroidota bacterium]